jgi:adenine phosphoribosyltransferase
MSDIEYIKSKIRTIPNFPKKGVMFRDITTLLKEKEGFKKTIDIFVERYKGLDFDFVCGIESRGFVIGSAIAILLGKGFIPIRKKSKLPSKTVSMEYYLEYGKETIEIHEDAIDPGQKVLLIDDLIATGGTFEAALKLIEKVRGKVVECACVIDLPELKGSQKIKDRGYNVFSILEFQGE